MLIKYQYDDLWHNLTRFDNIVFFSVQSESDEQWISLHFNHFHYSNDCSWLKAPTIILKIFTFNIPVFVIPDECFIYWTFYKVTICKRIRVKIASSESSTPMANLELHQNCDSVRNLGQEMKQNTLASNLKKKKKNHAALFSLATTGSLLRFYDALKCERCRHFLKVARSADRWRKSAIGLFLHLFL